MATAAGYSHSIKQFEEIKTKLFKQPFRGTMLRL